MAGFCGKTLFADDEFPVERRKDPFPSDPLYLAFPVPYSLPGIGSGWALTLYEANYGFYHRAYLIDIEGDAQGVIFGVSQAVLIPRHLLLELYSEHIGKFTVNEYTQRGMNTSKTDYDLIQGAEDYYYVRLIGTFWERRFEVYAEVDQGEDSIRKVLTNSGALISEFAHPPKNYFTSTVGNVLLDLTDEFFDPRRGVRLNIHLTDSPPQDATQPDYYVVTTSLFAYLPVGQLSTIAFTGFQSEAYVRKAGLTNILALNLLNNQGCAPSDRGLPGRPGGVGQQSIGSELQRDVPNPRRSKLSARVPP